MHAFRLSTFSLLLAQKFQQAKTCFQHLQPKFFQWVHQIYLLDLCYSEYVYHDICIIYTSEWKCLCCWLLWKSWLYSSHELDAHFTFIALNEHDPLWLKLWCYELDKRLWLKLAEMCCHMERFQHCTSLYLVDVMYFCLWMLTMGEINVEME